MFKDPAAFLQAADAYIGTEPFSSSVVGVWVTGVIAGTKPHLADDVFITVCDGDTVVGVAMHTPPFHLFLSRMPADAASHIAAALHESGRHLEGVNGCKEAVAAFTQVWKDRSGRDSILDTSMRLYYVDGLRPPTGVSGHPRPADETDCDLISRWSDAFHAEAMPGHPSRDAGEQSPPTNTDGFYLWLEDTQPVSMARYSPPVAGVSRVGPVYTPPEHRRHGYGSAVTAAATRAALDGGASEVILYTDLSNPTSNAIYQAIGYVADHDAEERSFVERAQT